jgi:hypothetical protein
MVQSLNETAARAAVGADQVERDREAWSPPRAPVGTVAHRVRQRGLDWEDFRDLYYPGTRRHNFRAILAYGAYKKSTPTCNEGASLEAWEIEGGAPR